MSNYNFAPTLNGLNNLDSNNVNSDTIITDYLTVNIASSVPTLPNGTNNNEIASTAFVQDAISTSGSNYVDLTNAQTITGQKTIQDLRRGTAWLSPPAPRTGRCANLSVRSGSESQNQARGRQEAPALPARRDLSR